MGDKQAVLAPIEERRLEFARGIDQSGTGGVSLQRYEPSTFEGVMALAQLVARAGLCPEALKGKDADVLMVLMRGAELGLGSMQALQNLHVVKGKIGMAADLMRARCQSHPDCVRFEVTVATIERAVVEVQKSGWPVPVEVEFTIGEAKRAGLVKSGGAWETWAPDMNVARATSRAARRYFPAVISGIYTPEELLDTNGPGEKNISPGEKPATKLDGIVEAAKAGRAAAAKAKAEPEPDPEKQADEPEPEKSQPEPGTETEPESTETQPANDPATAELLTAQQVRSLLHYAKKSHGEAALREYIAKGWDGVVLEDAPAFAYEQIFKWVTTKAVSVEAGQ